ncbi:hypothetical protein ACFQ1S_44480, partial [Kibdelosporangium lantanae]
RRDPIRARAFHVTDSNLATLSAYVSGSVLMIEGGAAACVPTSTRSCRRPSAGPAPRQAPPGRTILDLTGDGPKQTDKFTVSGDWHVQWSYDCTKTDTPVDSLVVQVLGGNTEIPVTHLGPTGADTQAYHDAGTFYLSVSSNCSWHVVVTG